MKKRRKNLADGLHKRINILAVLLIILILWSLIMSPGVSASYRGKDRFAPIGEARFSVTNSRFVITDLSTGPTDSSRPSGLQIRWAPDPYQETWDPWWAPPSRQKLISFIELPLVYPAILMLIGSAWLFRANRRKSRPGHCPSCNYNLAGLDSKTCPECGRGDTP